MRYLLSLEAFAVTFALAALVVALSARLPRQRLRWIPPVLLGWLPVGMALFWWVMMGGSHRTSTLRDVRLRFTYLPTLAWFVAAAIVGLVGGLILLSVAGLWRRGEPRQPVACCWRWPRVLGSAVALGVLLCATLWVADLQIISRAKEIIIETDDAKERLAPEAIPPAKNGAPLLRQAHAALMADGELPSWFDDSTEWGRWSFDVTQPEVQDFLSRHQPSIDQAIEASQRPLVQFPPPDGDITALPDHAEIGIVRELARLLGLSARAEGRLGHAPQFLARLDALARLEHKIRANPNIIWFLRGQACGVTRSTSVEYVLAFRPQIVDESPLPIHADRIDDRRALGKALEVERVGDMRTLAAVALGRPDLMPQWLGGNGGGIQDKNAGSSMWRVIWIGDEFEAMPRAFERLATWVEHPPHGVDAEGGAASQRDWGSIMTNLMVPGVAAVITSAHRDSGQSGLADLALAMTAYQRRHGEYPLDLNLLVPDYIDALPLDPWTGNSPVVHELDGGVVLVCNPDEQPLERIRAEPLRSQFPRLFVGDAYQKYRVEPELEEAKDETGDANGPDSHDAQSSSKNSTDPNDAVNDPPRRD